MSEVMRWKLKGFLPGVEGMCKAVMRPEVVMASDYDAAQSELAALREERDSFQRVGIATMEKLYACEQRLADAERRNAELIGLLETVPFGLHTGNMFINDECKCSQCEFVRAVNAALKPTESGASDV